MIGLINRGNLPDSTQAEFENLASRFREIWLTEHNEDGTHRSAERTLNFVPVGSGQLWFTGTAPSGWVLCDGSQVSRLTYKSLFDVITTTYGAGDGSTTFNVPDLRQRFPLGKANAGTGASLAGTGGAIDHTHTGGTVSGSTGSTSPGFSGSSSSDGSHTHTVSGTSGAGSAHNHTTAVSVELTAGSGTFAINSLNNESAHTHSFSATSSSDGSHTHSVSGTVDSHLHSAGTLAVGTSGTNNPPYLVVNYIIFAGV